MLMVKSFFNHLLFLFLVTVSSSNKPQGKIAIDKTTSVIQNNKETSSPIDKSEATISLNENQDNLHKQSLQHRSIASVPQNKESNFNQSEDEQTSKEDDNIDDFFVNSNIDNLLALPGDSDAESDDASTRLPTTTTGNKYNFCKFFRQQQELSSSYLSYRFPTTTNLSFRRNCRL